MPRADEVKPGKWTNMTTLFDNGEYSVISGIYGTGRHSLGERWNGAEGERGFPQSFGQPQFHVVPEFLSHSILHGLLDELARNPLPQSEEFTTLILRELSS
jgi:hypothetical protein